MKKYDSYKNSGVEWIGKVPSHWILNKVGNNTYVKGRIGWKGLKSEDFIDEGPYLITGTDFYSDGSINWDKMYHVCQERYDEDPFIQLKDHDVLITKDGTIGKVVYVGELKGQTCLNSGIFLTRPLINEYIPKYFYWVLNSNVFKVFVDYNSGGSTIQHLYQNVFVNFKIPLPSIPEQHQIVQYLDTKTNLIDTLILKTQEKINLLREKRISLINHSVTKGLNPHVEMKDSGVEWMGKIPKLWEVTKLKYGVRLVIDKDIPEQGNIKISPENVESNTGKCFNLFSDYTGEGMKFSSGDVLLNKLRLYLKKIILTEYDGYSMGEMIVLRSNNNLNNKYLFYLLFHQGLIDLLDSQSTGVKLPRVSPDIILNSEIVYPPVIEQLQIVEFLDDQFQKIDTIIQKEEKRVELLKEYRQSLISDIVTGKIKVTDHE